MKQKLFLLASICLFFLGTKAQTPQAEFKCGTLPFFRMLDHTPEEYSAISRSDTATLYIPVTVNILGSNSGAGYIQVEQALDMLCQLQSDFDGYGFHFYLENLNYIDNSSFNNMDSSYLFKPVMYQFIEDHNTLNSMNIYIVLNANGFHGFLSFENFYDYNYSVSPPVTTFIHKHKQGIVLDKDRISTSPHLLTHEVGHFFDLYHTFIGNWNDFKVTGTPDTIYREVYDPINDTTLLFPRLVERVDGLNCSISGDYICDTPPDYLRTFTCNDDQESDTIQIDPTGATFRSDGSLFMSYSEQACQSRFSPQQVNVMHTVAEGPRAYLLHNQTAPDPFVTSDLTLLYPPDNSTVMVPDSLTLEWEEMPGVDLYELEFGQFVANTIHYPLIKDTLLPDNSLKVQVVAGKEYYWKILAIYRYYPCEAVADTSYFEVEQVSIAEEFDSQQSIRLFPNPVTNRLHWRLPVPPANQASVKVHLFDARGRMLLQERLSDQRSVDVQGLPAGLYTLQLINGERTYVGKFVKQ